MLIRGWSCLRLEGIVLLEIYFASHKKQVLFYRPTSITSVAQPPITYACILSICIVRITYACILSICIVRIQTKAAKVGGNIFET